MSNLPEVPHPFYWEEKNPHPDVLNSEVLVLRATNTRWCVRHNVGSEAVAIIYESKRDGFSLRVWKKDVWKHLDAKFSSLSHAANMAWALASLGEIDFEILGENHEST